MNIYKIMTLLITLMILITGCTDKKNSVGFQPGMEPKVIELDFNYFGNCISFEDSVGNYYNNSKLIIGNYSRNNYNSKAYTLLRMVGLPDSIISIDSEVIIQMEKSKSHNFDEISTETLKFGKLLSTWKENEATWFNTTDSTFWADGSGFSESDYELLEINNIEIENDSISLELPEELLIDWIENDSLNFGITIFSDQEDALLELLSAESESVHLTFDYTTADIDSTVNFNAKFTSDTFIYSTDDEFQFFNDEIVISNIQPIKAIVEFDISDSVFINYEDSGIENSDDYRRMSINKAELILSFSDNNDYPFESSVFVAPYLVLVDTLNLDDTSSPLLIKEDYENFYDGTSSDSLNADNFEINIKLIVQYITSGERENNGIMIESIYENRDFINAVFANINDLDIEKRPKLRIIYTPPYLDE